MTSRKRVTAIAVALTAGLVGTLLVAPTEVVSGGIWPGSIAHAVEFEAGFTPLFGAASGSENRGTVELNDRGDGVVISASTAGTPDGRVRNENCSVYEPVLRYELSDVWREQIRPEADLDALVRKGQGDDELIKVRRTCKHRGPNKGGPNKGGNEEGVTVKIWQQSHWVSLKQLVGDLARVAIDTILFPGTKARFAPPARTRTLVGVDTWFWVPASSWRPITKVVGAPPVIVTAIATPTALRFMPGDGTATVTCPGPGLPWVGGGRTLCSHIYQQASTGRATGRYTGIVSIVWYVRWFSTTGASGTIGPIQIPQATSLKVAEAEAVLRT